MEIIRPYQQKDRTEVERICIATAGKGFSGTPARETGVVAAFCRYYIGCSPETCFVLSDAADKAVGYILCAPAFRPWCRAFPQRAKASAFGFIWSLVSILEALPHARQYPAHLHINLLAPYRRKGYGCKLIAALEQALRDGNCPGVMLCVGKDNHGAIRFYEAQGYRVLAVKPTCIAMGKKL